MISQTLLRAWAKHFEDYTDVILDGTRVCLICASERNARSQSLLILHTATGRQARFRPNLPLVRPNTPFTRQLLTETVFETELVSIDGVEPPKPVESASESVSSGASSVVDKATEGVKEKIMSKASEAAEAIKVTIEDTDADGVEHNEL